MVFEKPAREITADDIHTLIENGQREEQRLEYKEQFPSAGDERNKFIRHVAGMANTTGGCILLGVQEKRDGHGASSGEPERVSGLADANLDLEILRLASAIRDSVTPRIVPEPELHVVKTKDGTVVVMRVRRSLTKPHMFGQRFFARQGPQTVPLEVEQVRAEFLESEALPKRLRDFRADRLAEVLGGEARSFLARPANMVVHVCPLEAFTIGRRIDIAEIHRKNIAPPGKLGSFTFRLSFTGAVSYSGVPGAAQEYLQVFRNGCVEFATSDVVDGPSEGKRAWPLFRLNTVAQLLAQGVPSVIGELGEGVVSFPLAIMVSFFGIKGACAMRDGAGQDWTAGILDERALLQEVIVHSKPENWPNTMRETLDSVWQSVGRLRCTYYDKQNRFVVN